MKNKNTYWIVLLVSFWLRYIIAAIKFVIIFPVLIDNWIDREFDKLK